MAVIKSLLTINSSSQNAEHIEPNDGIPPTKGLNIVSAKETEQNKHRFSKQQQYWLICSVPLRS